MGVRYCQQVVTRPLSERGVTELVIPVAGGELVSVVPIQVVRIQSTPYAELLYTWAVKEAERQPASVVPVGKKGAGR